MSSYHSASGLLKDYYGLLDVAPGATRAEIDRAFKRTMSRYAPRLDPRTVADPSLRAEAELSYQLRNEKARELNEAYEVLSNPQRRAEYNLLLSRPGEGRSGSRGVRLFADPPFLYFGAASYGAPVHEFRLIAEPAGRSIPADLRIATPAWLEVQADGLGWGGYAATSPLRLRARLLPERLPFYGLTQDRIAITWSGGRLDLEVTAVLRTGQPSHGSTPQGNARSSSSKRAEIKRSPSLLRVILLQLLGLLAILGVFFLFQPAPKLVVLGLAMLVGVLCLAVETRAFSDIEHSPWYYKSLAFIVLAGMLPAVAVTALAS